MISYEPFWELLKESEETTYTLINAHGFSSATISRLRNNKAVSTNTLNELCKIFDCRIENIVEYIKE